MVAAGEAALENPRELEGRTAVTTALFENSDAPAAIAEDDQVFAQNAHGKRYIAEVGRDGDGLPKAAKVLAARRASPDLGELFVGLAVRPAQVSAIGAREGFGLLGHGARIWRSCRAPKILTDWDELIQCCADARERLRAGAVPHVESAHI